MNKRQLKWDLRYLDLAKLISTWSKDPSTQVGAILVRPNNSIASTGYNGFPPGHDDSQELYADREYKYKHVIHAEHNAVSFFCEGKELTSPRPCCGFTLYTSFPTCPHCMELAGRAGVSRVVGPALDGTGKTPEWLNEWRQRILEAAEMANRYLIQWDVVNHDTLIHKKLTNKSVQWNNYRSWIED